VIVSPELLAAHAREVEAVHEQVVLILAELRAIGERKAAVASRSHHKPLRDVSMSRERLALAYRQAGLKPPGMPA
jgi:hypothetical protein